MYYIIFCDSVNEGLNVWSGITERKKYISFHFSLGEFLLKLDAGFLYAK